jgi:tRNA (cmo5U34)-methyltransferase
MNDNTTPHLAVQYDAKIGATVPFYDIFHSETIDLVRAINPNPQAWLDTGCGTGTFVLSAMKVFDTTRFTLVDPSQEMLALAKTKLRQIDSTRITELEAVSSESLNLEAESFNVITAIQCHHYLDAEGRRVATENCFRMLKPEGLYVTFENIRPCSSLGSKIGLKRWKQYQISQGKSPQEADNHIKRFGHEYFPITIAEHIDLLKAVGFSVVELFWASHMQAGFYAIKTGEETNED